MTLFLFCLAILGIGSGARADLVLTGRLEDVAGRETLAQRALAKAQFSQSWEHFGVFFEGFAEGEAAGSSAVQRRSESDAYLQELYGEMKFEPLYVRIGRQAVRWSESWVLPSLDAWTERRWNRLFFDPSSEQFLHPTGLDINFVQPRWSLEGFYAFQVARSEFPQPLPKYLEDESPDASFGGRLKVDVGSLGLSGMAARAGWRDWQGLGVNYAFEKAVPKFETGKVQDRGPAPPSGLSLDYFNSFGIDIFLGEWTFQPQVTVFDVGDTQQDSSDYQAIAYLSATWKHRRHDLLMQAFTNTRTRDSFASLEYAFNWKKWFSIAGFAQSYAGQEPGLFWLFQEMTGGSAVGARLIFTADL